MYVHIAHIMIEMDFPITQLFVIKYFGDKEKYYALILIYQIDMQCHQ